MVNTKKIRWIPVLMVLSQLMLTGFVIYWLKNQYTDEKELLHADLSRVYDDSRNQVIDSLLFNRVVEPALKDSVTIVAVSMSDTLESRKATKGAMFAYASKKQDFLIRSVKLFINNSGDSISNRVGFPLVLSGNPDTVLFKKIYLEKVNKKNYSVSVSWLGNDLKAAKNTEIVKNTTNLDKTPLGTTTKKPGMYFSSIFPDNLPAVQVVHTFPYLIKRMSAQILFALILLLLTGSAFFFTNRSLNRQLILNSLRNDFVSNITHELRTPVSTVKVALEALKTFDKVKNPEITRDYLDMASQEMNRLDQLISKVLDQSLIGEKKQVIQTELSNIKHLIDNVLITLQPRITARNATIFFEASEITGPIPVDPLYFEGVLINLIDNSLKYGPEKPEIRIKLWQESGSACIEVSDNGRGIPKEHLNRIFDKFFRVPSGDIHNIKGYGLGLSFAALVMKQHKGSITVRNLDASGCAFTLTFPNKTT